MDAESREAVFSSLREKGIKAIKVTAADGSKANGEIRGVRKRMVAAIAGLTALAGGLIVYLLAVGGGPDIVLTEARPLPRQEVLGDRSRIEGVARELFATDAECFLSRFAEPGREFVAPESDWPDEASFGRAFEHPVMCRSNDFTEHIEIKRIVEGLKREAQEYLSSGGTAKGYVTELIRRQQIEIDARRRAEERLSDMLKDILPDDDDERMRSAFEFWLSANEELRDMGIYPVKKPQALFFYSGRKLDKVQEPH